ncbi:MAG: adenylosuccinate synthase [Bacteroidetes bacterium]|nr:adenylosuccinate synthase [Bacteroidota bacterium]
MKVDVLLGLQWGDEGKGKIVDYLAPNYQFISRFQGGPNAGHTLEFDGIKHVLHQIPSGVFRKNITNIIGNGVVLDPVIFKKEVEDLTQYKIDVRQNLLISNRAQLILPTHRLLDAAYEKDKGEEKIGSTLRGIGPAYQDKIARVGLRTGDALRNDFLDKYQKLVAKHRDILNYYQFDHQLEELEKEFFKAIDFLKTFEIVSTEFVINDALISQSPVLAEGAQGSLLDIDFGSYPFVTSSNTVAAGVCSGLGLAPSRVGNVFGIFKAYCTRVGSGPFPTELLDPAGERMRKEGNEFGATTGRPRRCGWLDLPALKYALMINGVSHLCMTKVDVLSVFEEIKVCTHYQLENGETVNRLPNNFENENLTPVYRSFTGWNQPINTLKEVSELPLALLEYIDFLEKESAVPISIISIGPDRTQTILRKEVFA